MKGLTGNDKMSVSALKEYFQPLETWLRNQTKGENLQWSEDTCSHVTTGDDARDWLEDYEVLAEAAYSRSIEADWNYNTDIKPETQDKMVRVFQYNLQAFNACLLGSLIRISNLFSLYFVYL